MTLDEIVEVSKEIAELVANHKNTLCFIRAYENIYTIGPDQVREDYQNWLRLEVTQILLNQLKTKTNTLEDTSQTKP